MPRVEASFGSEVLDARGVTQDLTYPVRSDGEGVLPLKSGNALLAPAGEVRDDQLVGGKAHLDLREDEPTTTPASPPKVSRHFGLDTLVALLRGGP